MLDADEYLHLAIRASKEGNHHAALEHLYRALEQEPNHTGARYLLAAEHAEVGLFERAYSEIQGVLEIAPAMTTARFQLGLLGLQLQRLDEARAAFLDISKDPADESLQAFSIAYLHLLEDRTEEARDQFSKGLEICTNHALKNDMTLILAALSEAGSSEPKNPSETENGSPVFLGAYRNSSDTI